MIELDFHLSPVVNEARARARRTAAKLDSVALRYNILLGDVILRTDEQDLSTAWGWVPMIDCSAAFLRIAGELAGGRREERFEFTESDAELLFRREVDSVVITSNYAPGEVCTTLRELTKVTKQLVDRVRTAALGEYPDLADNLAFLALLP